MALLATGSLLLALAALRLARALPRVRRSEGLLLAVLLPPALLVPLLLGLGLAGWLTPGRALGGVLLLATAVLALPGQGRLLPRRSQLWWRRGPEVAMALALLGAAALGLALVMAAALLLPPAGWDEWWYHLPPVAAAVQTGRLAPQPLPLEWSDPAVAAALYPYRLDYRLSQTGFWAAVYPQGAELWALWPALLLHGDALVDASQVYFALLGGAAIYALSRALGCRRALALTATGLWLCTPVVLGQSAVVASDLALAAAALAALAGCIAWVRWGDATALAIWALGAGLALATKATGLAQAGFWVLLALGLGWRRAAARGQVLAPVPGWRRAAGLGRLLAPAAAVAAGCAVLGGFWYWRNWRLWGNPIYPVSVGLGPLRLPGLGSVRGLFLDANTPPAYHGLSAGLRLLATWWEARPEWISYFSRTAGLGPAWTLAAVALLLLTPLLLTGDRGRGLRLVALLFVAFLLAVQPGAWWPRYVLAATGAGFALLATALQRLRPAPRRAALAALAAAALLGLPPAVGDIAGYAPAALRLPPGQRTIGRLLHGGYAWVDALPAGAVIAHAPMALIYPLYGRRFEHPVVQVDGAGPAQWLAAIRTSGAGWVCAVTGYGPHAAWARQLPHALRPAGEGGGLAVWRVLPPRSGTAAGAAPR